MKNFNAASAILAGVFLAGAAWGQSGPTNLLRNGSFEGGVRYWYEINDAPKKTLVGDAAFGKSSLKITKGWVQSAAFLLTPGKAVTISFSAKADEEPTTMGWQCSPCSREVGTRVGQTWGMRTAHPVPLTTEWKRYSFTFTPTAPQDGFWPRPTYMMQLGDAEKPILLDGVTVAYGGGAETYLTYRPVEAQVDCPDLKGYLVNGNLLAAGQTIRLVGTVSNPGDKPRKLTFRWQFVDYEGVRLIGKPVEQSVMVAPGAAASETIQTALPAKGLVLARFSAVENGNVLDSSDLPLTSLPYPKAATMPNPKERFGGTYFGPLTVGLARKIGFAWARWHPQLNWENHQPESADKWVWHDAEIDAVAKNGISMHMVLYSRPKWAFDDKSVPLPKDMNWPADDKRWEDLTVKTAWDNFITTAVARYRGKPLIYEIENEPEFDGWDNGKEALYAAFTIRAARLIKQTDPKARVMVNNVYGIPSGVNYAFLKAGGAKYIDIISWHDYHAGWLSDGAALRRMRNSLDELGGEKIQIWFNEGWAFTNTSVDEPAVALTDHNAAQSTNAMVDSIAEVTANGQEKTVLFYTGYEHRGMSFWDHAGPGTMLWDYYDYPTPLVAAWNVLTHHIGLSDRVAYIRPPGANLCIFQDKRNGKGVVVAYADRDAPADVTLTLPFSGLIAENAMGNATKLTGKKLTLSKTGRPVFLYSADKLPGKTFAAKLTALDRKNAGFTAAGGKEWTLPLSWDGARKGTANGNPILSGGKPIWRIDQIWPEAPIFTANYVPMVWAGTEWIAEKNGAGGQPQAHIEAGKFLIGARGSWSGQEGQRVAALIFIAPKSGVYKISGVAFSDPWAGESPALSLNLYKKDTQRAAPLKQFPLPRKTSVPFEASVELSAGHELVLVPRIDAWHNAATITLSRIKVEAK